MNKQTIITALIAVLLGLVSCSSDNDYEDKVEQVTIYVSAETGMFYNCLLYTSPSPRDRG